jgi:2-polyprenyl-6-methoxyphenol hydroxylase-like FAD-dependent oxidoreductase
MPHPKALIIGASIAGPATAYWLARAGYHITIIERHPSLRPGGQAVDIRTAGVSVMRKIPGMEALVRAKSTQEQGVSLVRDNGTPYGVIRATGNPDRQSLVSEYEIFRGDLSNVLYGLTREEECIQYVFGETVVSLSHESDLNGPITATFANGKETETYDLVVACDGATSRTRGMGMNCGSRKYVHATNFWAAYFSIQRNMLRESRIGQGFNASGGRMITIGSDPVDVGITRVMMMCVRPRGEGDATLSFREAAGKGSAALKKYVAQCYGDVGWKTSQILRDMMDSEDFYASEIVQVKLPRLSKGQFVLVGDAGYAVGVTGGGTSLALTGAYMLAGELGKHGDDISAGLAGYEQQMRPLITEMQKMPPLVGTIMAPQTAWGIWVRNQLFALVAWTGVAEWGQKYLGAAFASSDAFPLPEYKWVRRRGQSKLT